MGQLKRVIDGFERQGSEVFDTVDSAGAEEDQASSAGFAVFEDIQGPDKVVFHQLTGTRFAIRARQHTWIGRRIHHPIAIRQPIDVAGRSKVTVDELDSER